MSEVRLNSDEVAVLHILLSAVSVRDRTGEIGIVHGLGRFVSSNRTLSKQQRHALALMAAKLGIAEQGLFIK